MEDFRFAAFRATVLNTAQVVWSIHMGAALVYSFFGPLAKAVIFQSLMFVGTQSLRRIAFAHSMTYTCSGPSTVANRDRKDMLPAPRESQVL